MGSVEDTGGDKHVSGKYFSVVLTGPLHASEIGGKGAGHNL